MRRRRYLRWIVGVSTVSFVVALASVSAAGTTTTVLNNASAIAIATPGPGGSASTSAINVANVPGTITKLEVTLNGLTHPDLGELSVVLTVALPGFPVRTIGLMRLPTDYRKLQYHGTLMAANAANLTFADTNATGISQGASSVSSARYYTVVEDDFAPHALPANVPFRPWAQHLGVVSGVQANGVYRIYVWDDRAGNAGTLAGGWTLTIETTSDSTPLTFTGTSGPATPFPSTIDVANLSGTIADIQVTLRGVTHTFPDDLDIMLVGPGGQKVMLMSDVGGGFDVSNVFLTFATGAAPLPDATQISSGTYLPTDMITGDSPPGAPAGAYGTSLGTLVGTQPNGAWSLYVYDDSVIDTGSIAGWSIQIETTGKLQSTTNVHLDRFENAGGFMYEAERVGGSSGLATATITQVLVASGNMVPSDFIAFPSVATFADGAVLIGTIYAPVDDAMFENTEYLRLALTNAIGADVDSTKQSAFIVLSDEPGIASVSPAHGTTAGGTKVRVTLYNIAPGYTFTIQGKSPAFLTVQTWAEWELEQYPVGVPAALLGLYYVEITTPPGTAGAAPLVLTVPGHPAFTLNGGFTYVAPPANPTTDTDGDGMPDVWEMQFGLDPIDPADATSDDDDDFDTNLAEYQGGTHPKGYYQRFFAEGAVSTFFDTRFAVLNPDVSPAVVNYRFQPGTGSPQSFVQAIAGHSRATLDPKAIFGATSVEFSTYVESDRPITADRTMSWDANGYGAHAEAGVRIVSQDWFLAEGATHSGFSLFYLFQNPGQVTANVTVTYLLPSPAAPVVKTYTVPPSSRKNVWVNLEGPELAATDVSASIHSDRGIIVERAMYKDSGGLGFGAGHESAGVAAAAPDWFLAEGATGTLFDLFVLIANPNASDAQVQATYLLTNGTTVTKSYTVAAHSRRTVWVDLEDPLLANTSVSTRITSTNGVRVVVERSMWWPNSPAEWYEAHNASGATSTATSWWLAEGEQGGSRNVQTYILVANTSSYDGQARIKLFFEDGTTTEKVFPLAANSRFSTGVGFDFPAAAGKRFGATIQAEATGPGGAPQIVVERAMYWDAFGQFWAAGTDAQAAHVVVP